MFPDMFQIFNEEKGKEEGEEEETGSYAPAATAGSDVFVVSVGGSVLIDGKPNVTAIAKFSECINELVREGHKLVLVVGGGKVARDYIAAAKALGGNHFVQDELGIKVTRLNAAVLTTTVENACQKVLTEVKESKVVLEQGKTPIYGGLMPGFTTDAVGALIAEFLGGTFINLSNVDGVYTADPKTHPTAKLYPELSYDRLLSIVKLNAMGPGQNLIVDLPAAMVLRRSKIPAFFMNGNDLENFKAAVRGQEFRGTIVREAVAGERIELEEEDEEEIRPRRRVVRRKRTVVRRRKVEEEEDEEIDPDEIEM